jgi:hypothetical protein
MILELDRTALDARRLLCVRDGCVSDAANRSAFRIDC